MGRRGRDGLVGGRVGRRGEFENRGGGGSLGGVRGGGSWGGNQTKTIIYLDSIRFFKRVLFVWTDIAHK